MQLRSGSARLRRAVSGVPPETSSLHLHPPQTVRKKMVEQSRVRDGHDGTRDACAPRAAASLRLGERQTRSVWFSTAAVQAAGSRGLRGIPLRPLNSASCQAL